MATIDTGKVPEAQRRELRVMGGGREAERSHVGGTATPHSRVLCLSSCSQLHTYVKEGGLFSGKKGMGCSGEWNKETSPSSPRNPPPQKKKRPSNQASFFVVVVSVLCV